MMILDEDQLNYLIFVVEGDIETLSHEKEDNKDEIRQAREVLGYLNDELDKWSDFKEALIEEKK